MKSFIVTAVVVLVKGCQSVRTDSNPGKDTTQKSGIIHLPDSLRVGELIDGPAGPHANVIPASNRI